MFRYTPLPPQMPLASLMHSLSRRSYLSLSIYIFHFLLLKFGEGVVDTRTQYNMCTYVNVTTNRCKQ